MGYVPLQQGESGLSIGKQLDLDPILLNHLHMYKCLCTASFVNLGAITRHCIVKPIPLYLYILSTVCPIVFLQLESTHDALCTTAGMSRCYECCSLGMFPSGVSRRRPELTA